MGAFEYRQAQGAVSDVISMAVSGAFMDWVAGLLPIVCAAVAASWLSRHLRPRLWAVPAAVVSAGLCVLLNLGLPFQGSATELLLSIAVSAALVPALLVLFLHGPGRGRKEWRWMGLPFVLLLLLAAILIPWTTRIAYARRLMWACDGTITSKLRSHNHNSPGIVVKTADGTTTFDGVELAFWETARVGDRVVKRKGSIAATLSERTIRIVPRTMPWWNEPTR